MKMKTKQKNSTQTNQENAILIAPYYGQRGSIFKIEEEKNHYLVTRYDSNGKNGEKLYTPKRKRHALYKNYIDDVTKYLEKNHTKYITCKSNEPKKKIKKKQVAVKTTICSIITTASVLAGIFTKGSISYTCFTAFFVTFIASCNQFKEVKQYITQEQNRKFINFYNNYEEQVNKYNIEKDRTNSKINTTKYSKIKEEKQNKGIDLNIKRILRKDN